MNIRWGKETSVNTSGSTNTVSVNPLDIWKGVELTEPSMSFKHMVMTVDITYKDRTYKDVPTLWYLIEV